MKFSLVDRILELQPPERIVAVKAVSMAEEYLADHFPTFPVLPGVMMLESMADALYLKGSFDKSYEILNKCLELPSHSAEIYKKLCILSQKKGDSKQAERYLRLYDKHQKNNK